MNTEQSAEAARRSLGIGLESPVPDLLRLVEDKEGLRVFIVPLPERGIEGAYQVDDDVPYALVNQNAGHPVRKRFTLAHEFGHHKLRHGAQLDAKIQLGDTAKKESEANQFAGAFLMPRPAIDDWFAANGDPKLDLEVLLRIAYFFNVSAFVARYRLEAVNRLASPALKSKIDQALDRGDHYRVAQGLRLTRPKDSIDFAHEQGGYVPAEMELKIGELLRKGLLGEEAAKARLRLSESAAERKVKELLTMGSPSGNGGVSDFEDE